MPPAASLFGLVGTCVACVIDLVGVGAGGGFCLLGAAGRDEAMLHGLVWSRWVGEGRRRRRVVEEGAKAETARAPRGAASCCRMHSCLLFVGRWDAGLTQWGVSTGAVQSKSNAQEDVRMLQ